MHAAPHFRDFWGFIAGSCLAAIRVEDQGGIYLNREYNIIENFGFRHPFFFTFPTIKEMVTFARSRQ
jgi:hypothetical protein